MKTRVFVDGNQGTTGLKIFDRLSKREDIELITVEEEKRKDAIECARLINSSDITFLCLPDEASRQAVSMASGRVRIIDTSTAHRTNPDWAYGFAELSPEHRKKIAAGARVAVPGCHASGFIASVYPLVKSGLIAPKTPLCSFSLTGYSGGGKKMIASYENDKQAVMGSPMIYGMTQQHKHLKEMTAICGLSCSPHFSPVVDDYFSGMAVTVPLFGSYFKKRMSPEGLYDFYSRYYEGSRLISVNLSSGEGIYASTLSGYDNMIITVAGNEERMTVTALFDNLGKGASGAAMQCMNIMLGVDETKGLSVAPAAKKEVTE